MQKKDQDYFEALGKYLATGSGTDLAKFKNFAKYAPRQFVTKFLCQYEIFKQILHVQGSIIECGVLFGGSLMTWAQLSEIFEPLNYQRQIIGFDTFEGFPDPTEQARADMGTRASTFRDGANAYEDLQEAIRVFNMNRFLPHKEKVRLVKGDATETIPAFLEQNEYLVISLLCLDFDVYEPTVTALRHFVPRMPLGSVIVFDELNSELWPGETIAVMKEMDLGRLRIRRFPFDTFISYAVLE